MSETACSRCGDLGFSWEYSLSLKENANLPCRECERGKRIAAVYGTIDLPAYAVYYPNLDEDEE